MSILYDFSAITPNGETKRLSDYEGQTLLIVNVASKCGLTPQYAGLEQLYRAYRERGFRILAFPCNDFGEQEPGTLEEIQQFCSMTYGVSFELFDKVHCLGEDKHPLFQWLTSQPGAEGEVQWNFEKFLIDKQGRLAARFGSRTAPEDPGLTDAIEKALKA